ncbi:MAG: GNAT family N-acetyltransferase [Proteobacteria bacterium]|nr:GNAT family N-acetyltransferase [Pseudomonadota bacterium]
MHIRSLAMRTELALHASRGRVVDRGDYIVVTSPEQPHYYYGNLLVLRAAPQVGEVSYWCRKFAEELGHDPAIRHVTFAWDDPTGATGARDELVDAGFTVEVNAVMTATTVTAPPIDLPIRPLAADEVARTAELAFTIGDLHVESYRAFLKARAAWHASLVFDGSATFWGAFDGDALVGSLGLVTLDDVRRYQDVQTAPTHRKRGIAAALLATAAHAADPLPVVIVAEPDSEAARVYARVGFATVEATGSACRRPTG